MSTNIKTWQSVALAGDRGLINDAYCLKLANQEIATLRAALAQSTITCRSAEAAIVASMLEGYAQSYDIMARDRTGSGRVDCSSVAVDLRQNMIPQARKILATQPVAEAAAKEDDSPLSDFKEGQWWVKELDQMAQSESATLDQKRAVAVVHHMLRATLTEQPTLTDIMTSLHAIVNANRPVR